MPSVRSKLTTTEKFNFQQIPTWVAEVAKRLMDNNFQAFLVGGAVRDLLWEKAPNDWDLATDALPDQIASLFSKTIATGEKFGTITVIWNGHQTEITTLREDLAYIDGRHPQELHFTKDILADLGRRDFTINAIAYDFLNQELVDPFGGKNDIRKRLLKAVGDPKRRFREDGLRMFRFYRFLATLELRPHRPTEWGLNSSYATGVSLERIQEEFSKLLVSPGVDRGLQGLKKSNLLNAFLPELIRLDEVDKQGFTRHASNSLWEHSKMATVTIRPQLHLRLAALFHDIAKPLTQSMDKTGVHFYGHERVGAELGKSILERLHYPQKIIQRVTILIHNHMFYIDRQSSDAAIRRLAAKVGPEMIFDLLELRRADIVATDSRIRSINYQTWESWHELYQRITLVLSPENQYNPFQLVINGQDLIEQFQLAPGPVIGEILSYLKELILEEPSQNQKTILLELARNYLDSKNTLH
ncbi:MAG TPA: hypothetical protein DDW50_09660 [Firmicutes bacterium]|jgi:tRNA nucleotidyltransferase (CCA-adding enzyme)|nr:hypothetical protein [Bacillota bacterium]